MRIKIYKRIVLICVVVLLLASCGKDKVNHSIIHSWKVERLKWEKITPDFTQAGEIEYQDSYFEFYSNGKGKWSGSIANRSFSYYLTDSMLHMSEIIGENDYKIITLNGNDLTLELNKEKVDWDKDGVAEDIHDVFYCHRN